jgi:hypothetical protein
MSKEASQGYSNRNTKLQRYPAATSQDKKIRKQEISCLYILTITWVPPVRNLLMKQVSSMT